MTTETVQKSGFRFPIFQGILPIDRAQIPLDVLAGVTLAALAIPEVMGYTQIAGMPVITGLYTILIPMALFAIFGSSRHLVVGADSATAAILAAGLAGMATTASSEYVALAGLLALMAAGLLILARLIKLGFLADFLSRTVLIGFLTGVGIQVAVGQISGMLGIAGGSGRPIPKTYVKVYAEMQDGSAAFYKDGYTDLRGRFDYTSLSTNELDRVKRFSILVLDDTRGGLVQEARVPKQ